MLGDDHLREPLLVRLLTSVVLVAVDEADDVGVLLDRSRLAQVREYGALVVALLDGPRELRHRDDRYVEVAGEHLAAGICAISCTRFSALVPEVMSCR